MTTIEISRYGADANQARACGFDAAPGVSVLVRPTTCDRNADALRIAERLAGSAVRLASDAAELALMRDRVASLEAEVAAARAKIPPKKPIRLFGPGRVRFDQRGRLWLLDPAKGWSGTGFMLDGWDDLFRRFAVRVTHHGADADGPFWAVENAEERAA